MDSCIKETIYVDDLSIEDFNTTASYKSENSELSDQERLERLKRFEVESMKHLENFKVSKGDFVQEIYQDVNAVYDINTTSIGEGGFGEVYMAKHKKTEELRAIKKIRKKKIHDLTYFENEVMALKLADHPNIIKLYELYQDDKYVYLVQELCTGGSIFQKITSEEGNFTEKEAAEIFEQILNALVYWHKNRICHRDLKPENFMVKSEDDSCIKLIDFGLAKWYVSTKESPEPEYNKLTTDLGTPFFKAPEVLGQKYTFKCDIWSAGVLLYIMLSGLAPFSGETQEEINASILACDYEFYEEEWSGYSDEVKDLISQCFRPEVTRPTAKKLLKHSWFKKFTSAETQNSLSPVIVSRLKTFQTKSKLRKTINFYMALHSLGPYEKKCREMFKELDTNRDGLITKKELKKKFKEACPDCDTDKMFADLDLDDNGYISYTEFIAACVDEEITKNPVNARQAFDFLDQDRDNLITEKDFKILFGGCEDEVSGIEVRRLVYEVIYSIKTNYGSRQILNCILDVKSINYMSIRVIYGLGSIPFKAP